MPTTEHLAGQWREWRHAHLATMFRPYGWTSLVAQYWLEEGDRGIRFELLPGTWGVEDGRVIFTPPASGPTLSVDGAYPTGPGRDHPGPQPDLWPRQQRAGLFRRERGRNRRAHHP